MTSEELISLLVRNGLSREDLAAIAGRTTRQTYWWTSGKKEIPRSLCLILTALDQGKVSIKWLSEHLET
jgi:hypothetical protein